MRLGVLATREPYQQHTRPVWEALGAAERERYCTVVTQARGADPSIWLVAASRDFQALKGHRVMMEHGTGLQAYAPHELMRLSKAAALAVPNEFVAALYRSTITKMTRIEVVGTPKMDALVRIPKPETRTVAVSFHWSGRQGLGRYREALGQLAASVRVIGHAHPRIWAVAVEFYEALGIEAVQDFAEVVRRADVYVCDHSSTLYEFAALERPVVLLERRGAQPLNTTGLRYTAFADIGATASPGGLADAAAAALDGDPEHKAAREAASAALYPFMGSSTGRVIDLLRSL